jgi:hypothetical protein
MELKHLSSIRRKLISIHTTFTLKILTTKGTGWEDSLTEKAEPSTQMAVTTSESLKKEKLKIKEESLYFPMVQSMKVYNSITQATSRSLSFKAEEN